MRENDRGFADCFIVEGEDAFVSAFYEWWNESGMASHAADRLEQGDCFVLTDYGNGGGDVGPFDMYFDWRQSFESGPVVEEPALLAAA